MPRARRTSPRPLATTTTATRPPSNAPLSRNSTSLYDELNRLKQITDPASGITLFGYDANDNLTSVTDPRLLVTSYTYTGFGDLKTQTSPDTGVTTNTYDSGGNLDTSTDSRGAVTDYGYDAANRVTSASFTLGGVTDQTITYSYDARHEPERPPDRRERCQPHADLDLRHARTRDGQGPDGGRRHARRWATATTPPASSPTLCCPRARTIAYGYNTNGQVTSVTLNGSTHDPEWHHLRPLRPDHGLDLGQRNHRQSRASTPTASSRR